MGLLPTLADYMIQSETSPFLLCGPECSKPGWVYRDFTAMPQQFWFALLDVLDLENINVVAANSKQLPPADLCRAQLFISPKGQENWAAYLKEKTT